MLFSRLCRCGCSILFHAVPTFKSQNGGFWNCVSRFTIQHCRSRPTVQSSENETSSDPRLTAHSKCHGFTRLSSWAFSGVWLKCWDFLAEGWNAPWATGSCPAFLNADAFLPSQIRHWLGFWGQWAWPEASSLRKCGRTDAAMLFHRFRDHSDHVTRLLQKGLMTHRFHRKFTDNS